jgi:hypothetical protein
MQHVFGARFQSLGDRHAGAEWSELEPRKHRCTSRWDEDRPSKHLGTVCESMLVAVVTASEIDAAGANREGVLDRG